MITAFINEGVGWLKLTQHDYEAVNQKRASEGTDHLLCLRAALAAPNDGRLSPNVAHPQRWWTPSI